MQFFSFLLHFFANMITLENILAFSDSTVFPIVSRETQISKAQENKRRLERFGNNSGVEIE